MKRRKKPVKVLPGGKASYKLDDNDPMVILAESYGHPDNLLVFRPEAKHLIPEGGAWVMLTRRLPPMEREIEKKVIPGSIVFVTRQENADAEGFRPDGSYIVDVLIPEGFKLWPYEYVTIDPVPVVRMWADGELVFHPVESSTKQLNDTVFYCRSRGIGLADAMVMALGTLTGPIGWFEPAAALREACIEMGDMRARMGILTDVNHQRRAAAQARRQA